MPSQVIELRLTSAVGRVVFDVNQVGEADTMTKPAREASVSPHKRDAAPRALNGLSDGARVVEATAQGIRS